jgi:hypothetical protein
MSKKGHIIQNNNINKATSEWREGKKGEMMR